LLPILLVTLVACGGEAATVAEAVPAVASAGDTGETVEIAAEPEQADPGAAEVLPGLEPVTLAEGEKLRVVATTSLVADVVRRVAGDAVDLTTLIPLGTDPHGYAATPEDLRTLNDAHLILTNGLGLEEALLPVLGELDNPVPVVSVNAGLAPLTYGEGTEAEAVESEEEAEATGEEQVDKHLLDPHTWLSINNMLVWIDNVAAVLAMLDTANVDDYFSNAGAYHDELAALDTELRAQIDTLPEEQRKLVTDHREFNYFANDYGFQVLGSVIPGISTTAAPSAQELAALQDLIEAEGVKAIFVGENVDDSVASQLANDLGIEVVKLYTSSLSDADGPAPDYPSLMRYDVDAIVSALAE
jgi:zinc/manganese transport system substrate-binding protein/manganese/iron transport system substrate-binding protein